MPKWRDTDGNDLEWAELGDRHLIMVHLLCCEHYRERGSRFWGSRMDAASAEIIRRGLVLASLEARAELDRRAATVPNAARVTVVWGAEVAERGQTIAPPVLHEPQVGETWLNIHNNEQYTIEVLTVGRARLRRARDGRRINNPRDTLLRDYRFFSAATPAREARARGSRPTPRTWEDSQPTQARSVGFGNRCAAHNNLACGHCDGTAPKKITVTAIDDPAPPREPKKEKIIID